jgi:protein LSM14
MFDTFDNGPPGPGQFHDRLGGGGRYGDHGPDRRMPPREKGGGGYGGKGGGPSEDRGYGYGYGKGKGGKSQHTGQNFKPSQGATPSREFASAFDFEQSNAKLDMEAVAQEVEKEETLDEKKAPASTYNKDSFFDEISCEALDRKSGGRGQYTREMRDAQRQVDIETFGKMSLDSSRGDSGYKGGYRGGKGKGMGYKGSGGKGMGY